MFGTLPAVQASHCSAVIHLALSTSRHAKLQYRQGCLQWAHFAFTTCTASSCSESNGSNQMQPPPTAWDVPQTAKLL